MEKPLTQRLFEQQQGGRSSAARDAALIARSFGVALEVDKPFPEAVVPDRHAEDDDEIILLDTRARRPEPQPSLLSLVMARLQSLTPRTAASKKKVSEAISSIIEPVKAIDALVDALELEHFHAIDKRWEEIRKQGRALLDSKPAVQVELAQAMQAANASLAAKGQRRLEVRTYYQERRRMSVWSTAEEIRAVDLKFERAQEAAREAEDKALEDQRTQAAAEGKLATVEANLKLLHTELHRLQAELHGEPYFDPSLGLSKSPVFYRDKW